MIKINSGGNIFNRHPSQRAAIGVSGRSLTDRGKSYLMTMSLHETALSDFPRGDEFYGTVLNFTDHHKTMTLRVRPLVGTERLADSSTLYLADSNGQPKLPAFFLASFKTKSKTEMIINLEKPSDAMDTPTISFPGETVTTNGNAWPFKRRILASYDSDTVTVYQAFREEIAKEALSEQHFGWHFRSDRTTWIKTSFLWMMERSGWGSKPGQERILAIHLLRPAFESLLKVACVTDPTFGLVFRDRLEYQRARENLNLVQWDPDRDLSGKRLRRRAIQIGIIPRHHRLYHQGIRSIDDVTEKAKHIRAARSEREKLVRLPTEVPYPAPSELLMRLEMHQYFNGEDMALINQMRAAAGLPAIKNRSASWMVKKP